MHVHQPKRVGFYVARMPDRALLAEAVRLCGLLPVKVTAEALAEGDRETGPLALLVVDRELAAAVQARLQGDSCWTAPPLLVVLDGEEERLARAPGRDGVDALATLRQPLSVEAAAGGLSQAFQAQQFFVLRHTSLLEEVHRYRSVFESIGNGVTISRVDQAGTPLAYMNPAFERMTGYTAEEALGRNCKFLQGVDTEQPGVHRVRAAIREGRHERALLRNYRKDGTLFWNELYLSPIFDLAGELTHFVGIQNDVTDKVEAEQRLAEERDRLQAAAECSMDCLYICEAVRNERGEIEDFVFTFLNSNVEQMVSIPLERMLGQRMCELLPVNRTLGLFERYQRVVETGEPLVYEFPVQDKDVRSAWIRVQAVKLKDGIVITASDITLRKREEERTLYLAHHDVLTGLANRTVLLDRVNQGMEWARRHGGMLGVFVLDLDGFKQINDSLGHAAGDQTLVTAAGRLAHCMRGVDSVIRIGGDEFVVVMPELRRVEDACTLASRMLDVLKVPMQVHGQTAAVTGSIGIALYPEAGLTAEELVSRADAAMYCAKRRGKDQFEIYVPKAEQGEGMREVNQAERAGA